MNNLLILSLALLTACNIFALYFMFNELKDTRLRLILLDNLVRLNLLPWIENINDSLTEDVKRDQVVASLEDMERADDDE